MLCAARRNPRPQQKARATHHPFQPAGRSRVYLQPQRWWESSRSQVPSQEVPPRRRDQRRAAPVRPPPLSRACEETLELPGRLRALARAPLRDQEVPPRRRDQGPGALTRRDVESPSSMAVHERRRRGALVQLRTVVCTGDTRDTRPLSDISRALGLGL
jgi:hypothetical protein